MAAAVEIPLRLMTPLRYWQEASKKIDKKLPCLHVINDYGAKVIKPHKAFRAVRDANGLGDDITPHTLRHTRATWLANAGVDV